MIAWTVRISDCEIEFKNTGIWRDFLDRTELANRGRILIAYSDSSFTNPHEVVRPDEPPECTGNFTHMGAKYWGFETERHRSTSTSATEPRLHYNDDAYHWLHLGLISSGLVSRIQVSTRWFTGNQVPEIAIELTHDHRTTEVLTRTPLKPDAEHVFEIEPVQASEVLVRCFHEGGIARINLFGEPTGEDTSPVNLLERASISHVSNEHYGKPADAVKGNREVDYMLGWESARSGFGEHALFQLESPCVVSDLIVDTYMHRLNPPLTCHLFGASLKDDAAVDNAWRLRPVWELQFEDGHRVRPDDFAGYMQSKQFRHEPVADPARFDVQLVNEHNGIWQPLVSFGRLRADTWHHFREMETSEPSTHLLYMHYPNGGIHGRTTRRFDVGKRGATNRQDILAFKSTFDKECYTKGTFVSGELRVDDRHLYLFD